MTLSTEKKQELIEKFPDEYNQLVELGQKIGAESLDKVMEVFGGQKPHIPMIDNFYKSLVREIRDQSIRSNYDPGKGRDYKQIAIDFSGFEDLLGPLSERQVREIVHAEKRHYQRPPENMKPIKIQPDIHDTISVLASKHDIQMHKVMHEAWVMLLENYYDEFKQRLNKKYGVQLQMVVGE